MVNEEVKVETDVTTEETTNNKFEVPSTFREKYAENPDLAIEELYKAQHKIVQQKKAEKQEPKEDGTWLKAEDVDKMLAEREFFKANPDLEEYKDQINEFTSKGLTHDDAKVLLERKDPTIANRKIANQSNFTSGQFDNSKTTYTKQELENMSQTDYNKVRKLMDEWKVSVK